jgi:hypothetical protein
MIDAGSVRSHAAASAALNLRHGRPFFEGGRGISWHKLYAAASCAPSTCVTCALPRANRALAPAAGSGSSSSPLARRVPAERD